MICRNSIQLLLMLCSALAMFSSSNRAAWAQANRQTNGKLKEFAEKVIKFLEQEEQTAIVVGKVSPLANAPVPGGPGLVTQLIATLNGLKPNIVSNAAMWTIEGQMVASDDSQAGLVSKVKFRVINQATLTEWSETIVISRLSEVLVQVGGNVQSDPDADLTTFRKEVIAALETGPSVDATKQSVVRPAVDSPYGLELRVKPLGAENRMIGVPVPVGLTELPGLLPATTQQYAFAPIEENQTYEVVVYNDSAEEIAAAIYVDGIDIFTFSEDIDPKTGRPRFTHLILPPQSYVVLPGWHQTSSTARDDNFLSFLVTQYGKGRRSQVRPNVPPVESVGAVTVAISRSMRLGDVRAKSSAETGVGVPVKQDQKPVERIIDTAHTFITVRYAR